MPVVSSSFKGTFLSCDTIALRFSRTQQRVYTYVLFILGYKVTAGLYCSSHLKQSSSPFLFFPTVFRLPVFWKTACGGGGGGGCVFMVEIKVRLLKREAVEFFFNSFTWLQQWGCAAASWPCDWWCSSFKIRKALQKRHNDSVLYGVSLQKENKAVPCLRWLLHK